LKSGGAADPHLSLEIAKTTATVAGGMIHVLRSGCNDPAITPRRDVLSQGQPVKSARNARLLLESTSSGKSNSTRTEI